MTTEQKIRAERIFRACVVDERSLANVAHQEGITRERVRQIVQRLRQHMMHPDVLGKRKLAPPPEGTRLHGLDHLRAEKQLWEILLQKWLAKQPPRPPTTDSR